MTTATIFKQFAALASLLCVCAPAAEAHPPASQSQDSVAYQVNQDHSGSIAFTGGFSGSLSQLWSVNFNGIISYPLTAHGQAFVTIGAQGGSLLAAIDLSTGATNWEKLLPGSSSWADAVYDQGKIFVANGSGELLAFRQTGKPLWSVQLSSSNLGAPAARNGMVVLQYDSSGYYQQSVSAYDEVTGTNLWSVAPDYYGADAGISGLPLLSKSGVYVSGEEGFYGLSSSDGSTIWSATFSNCAPYDTPVRSRTKLFVVDTYNCNYGENTIFDLATGSVQGTFAGSNAPVVLGKTLIISLDGVLYDYSPDSGNVHWSFTGSGNFSSKPIVINGYVAALSEQGDLYLLDGSTGAQLWTTTLNYNYGYGQGPDSGLGAGEGILLVPYGGALYAFAPQQGAKRESRPEPTRVIGHLINGRFIPN